MYRLNTKLRSTMLCLGGFKTILSLGALDSSMSLMIAYFLCYRETRGSVKRNH